MKWLSLDTDIFDDGKIKKLRREYNNDGWFIYSYLLVQVANEIDMDNTDNGYFELADGDDPGEALAWEINLPEDKVKNILELLADLELINSEKFKEGEIYIPKLLDRTQTESFLKKQEGGRKGGKSKKEGSSKESSKESLSSPPRDKDKDLDKEKQNTTKSNDLSTDSNDDTPELKNYHTNTPDKPVEEWNANDLIKYFGYEMWQEYKVPYVPKNWGKDASNAKNLIKKHGAKTIARAIWWLVHTYEKKPKHFGWVFGSINQFLEWRAEKQEQKEYQEWLDKEQEKAEEAIDKYEEKYGDSDEFVQTSEILGGSNE